MCPIMYLDEMSEILLEKDYYTKKKDKSLHKLLRKILQYNIKKGKKATLEIIFKNTFFYMAKNKNKFKIHPKKLIFKGFLNIISYFYLKTTKRGRKVFYKVQFISKPKQFFILNSWFCKNLNKKKFIPMHIDLAHELKNLFLKKSKGVEKKKEYTALVLKHMPYKFLKKKNRFRQNRLNNFKK